jgi:hypothetical protein
MKIFAAVCALLCSITVLICAGPAGADKEEKSLKPPAKTSPAVKAKNDGRDLPVIAHIEKRDRWITVKSGANGPVYYVQTKSGEVLVRNLSEDQLKAQNPELLKFIKTAIAQPKEKGSAYLDSRTSR